MDDNTTKKMRQYDPHEFIRMWNTLETAGEVASKLKLSKEKVGQIANQFRKKGVYLKPMRKGPNKSINFEELVKFSNKWKKDSAPTNNSNQSDPETQSASQVH